MRFHFFASPPMEANIRRRHPIPFLLILDDGGYRIPFRNHHRELSTQGVWKHEGAYPPGQATGGIQIECVIRLEFWHVRRTNCKPHETSPPKIIPDQEEYEASADEVNCLNRIDCHGDSGCERAVYDIICHECRSEVRRCHHGFPFGTGPICIDLGCLNK